MTSTAAGMMRIAHYIGGAGELEQIQSMCAQANGETLLDWIYSTTEHIPQHIEYNDEFVRWIGVLNTISEHLKPDGREDFKVLLAAFSIIRKFPLSENYPFRDVTNFWLGFREFCVENHTLAS